MTFCEFLDYGSVLSFFLVAVIVILIGNIIIMVLRHINIIKHGWPPEHCDADGDQKSDDNE